MRERLRGLVIVAAVGFLSTSPALAQEFTQQGPTLVGTDANGIFGKDASVALSADGNTAIVGSPGPFSFTPPSVGGAWIFTRSNGIWTQQGPKLLGTAEAGNAQQGFSVAMSADGNTAAVGAPADNSNTGAVWIFVRSGTTWTQQGSKLVGSASVNKRLGEAIALSADGSTLLVGGTGSNPPPLPTNGWVWVFTRSGGLWTEQARFFPGGPLAFHSMFGQSVALSGDGNTAVIGGPYAGTMEDDFIGAAWIYTRSGSSWSQLGAPLVPAAFATQPKFGWSTAISYNGQIIAIGGPRETTSNGTGAIWTYKRNGSTFTQTGSPISGATSAPGDWQQGTWVALSGDGTVLLDGSPGGDALWAFTRDGDTWTPLGGAIAASGSGFGEGIALSADGYTAAQGVSGASASDGGVNFFTRPRPQLPGHGAGDIDGDGRMDAPLLTANGDWAFLKSSTAFTAPFAVNWTSPGSIPVRGDFDGDNMQDPALYDPLTGAWRILTSSSNFTSSMIVNWGGLGYVAAPGDYDGDGRADPALYQPFTGLWLILESSTTYTTSKTVSWGGPAFTPVPGQDFDGDGKSDIAVYRQSNGVWSVLESTTSFSTGFNIEWGAPGVILVPGDYDGDFKTDLATFDCVQGLWRILTSSSGYTTSRDLFWGGATAGHSPVPVPGLFDADAIWDLGLYYPSTGTWRILLGAANFTTDLNIPGWGSSGDVPVSTAITVGSGDRRRAGDQDGDGRSDITTYNVTSGVWTTLLSGRGFFFSTSGTWGGTGHTAAPGDYDGDGRTDRGLYDGATGWWSIRLSRANFTTSITKNVGGPGWAPVPGDYDGDGRTDLAVYNTSTGQWYGLNSSTNYTTTFSISYGGTGWMPVPADYDGDGRIDIGVYEVTTGLWSVLLSSTNFTTNLGLSCGGTGWTPVPGDYDGDARADIVVYNENPGQWYGLMSSTNFTSTVSVMWGGSNYLPVKGDYDGDGRADFATYVSSSGMWYILLSAGGSIVQALGGPGYVALPQYP